MGQLLREGPATHRGGIDEEAQPPLDFGGGAAIRGGRFGREQFAQEGGGAVRPGGSVITTGGSRPPAIRVVVGDAPEIVAVEFVEAGAAQAELVRGGESGDFVAAEGGEDFADQRSTQTVRELAIMFFIAARMPLPEVLDQRGPSYETPGAPIRSGEVSPLRVATGDNANWGSEARCRRSPATANKRRESVHLRSTPATSD